MVFDNTFGLAKIGQTSEQKVMFEGIACYGDISDQVLAVLANLRLTNNCLLRGLITMKKAKDSLQAHVDCIVVVCTSTAVPNSNGFGQQRSF